MSLRIIIVCVCIGPALILAKAATASDYGTTGLIDTPTARMQNDGTFAVTGAWDGLHKSYMFTYQVTPWLEGTFRYTGFNDFLTGIVTTKSKPCFCKSRICCLRLPVVFVNPWEPVFFSLGS